MGTTGFSSGVHLHWEIKDPTLMNNGYKGRFDPLPFVCDWDSSMTIQESTTTSSDHPIDILWNQLNPKQYWKDYADKSILTA